MKTKVVCVGAYEVNCAILERDGRVLVVDPGAEADRILAALDAAGLVPSAILVTHGHFDHIGGIPGLKARWPDLPVLVSAADAAILTHPFNQCPPDYPPFPGVATEPPEAHADEFGYAVIPTPGHTPGGVCYHFAGDGLLLSGDTLFCGSVGRTDFPGGDMSTLLDSLRRLRTLPDSTRVIPGHGPETTIGAEKGGNPFLLKLASLAAVALVALLAGCSAVRSAREAQRAAEPAGRGEIVAREKLNLRGRSLRELVDFAFTNRPEMVNARLAVEDARLKMKSIAADAPIIGGTPWTAPHLSLSGGYSETSPGASAGGGGDWRTYGDPSAGLSLDLLVYDFGRNRAQARAQAERVVEAEETLAEQGYTVFGEVAKAYFDFVQARSMLDVKITTRNDYAEQLALVEARLEAGESQQLDVLRAKVDLAGAVQEVVTASNSVRTTGATFMLALGVDLSRGEVRDVLDLTPIAFGTVCRAFPDTVWSAGAAYDLARTNSPEMCIARAKLRAASRDVDYAIADLRPKVTATLSINWLNPLWVWGWGVSAVQPVFEGFKRTTAIERATVSLKTAEANLDATSHKLSSNIQTAVSVRDNAVEGLVSSLASVRSAKENMDLVTGQFAVGEASRIDQSAAVAQYWSAVGDAITAFYAGQRAEAALYAILGSRPVYREEKLEKIDLLK